MRDPETEAPGVAPEGDGETGVTNRRGRGVFAAVLLLLLLLCAVTTITQSYVTAGKGKVVRAVTDNLECLQCHTELIPQFSMNWVHNPFMDKRCTTCHTPHGKIETTTVYAGVKQWWNRTRTLVEWLPLKIVLDVFDTSGGGSGSSGGGVTTSTKQIKGQKSYLVMPETELCWMCHGDMGPKRQDPYAHAPFMTGHCTDCHNPHASNYEGMLVMDVRQLCITCHPIGPEMHRKQVHNPVAGLFCTNCHDPHASKWRGMLVARQRELCFRCHPSVAHLSLMGVQHGPFLNDDCTGCHEPHGSDYLPLLRKPEPTLCYMCHPNIQNDFKRASHHPVGTMLKCSSCHNPHATNYRGLLYAENNDICYACHRVPIQATYDRSAHFRTPCWRCHTPHGSDYSPLLQKPQPDVCFQCHPRFYFDDRAGGYKNHPVRAVYWDVHSGKALSCTSTCHNPHGTNNNYMLKHYNFPKDGNCLICHAVAPGDKVGVNF